MDKDVDTSSETETFLEEIPGGKLIDIGLGRNFLDIIQKTQETKVKINKWNYIKLKKPLHSKGNNQQNEKSAYEKGENNCKTYILNRINIQNICK